MGRTPPSAVRPGVITMPPPTPNRPDRTPAARPTSTVRTASAGVTRPSSTTGRSDSWTGLRRRTSYPSRPAGNVEYDSELYRSQPEDPSHGNRGSSGRTFAFLRASIPSVREPGALVGGSAHLGLGPV